jgi:hypothetical protein
MLDVDVVEANDIAGLDCIRRSGKPFPTVEGETRQCSSSNPKLLPPSLP